MAGLAKILFHAPSMWHALASLASPASSAHRPVGLSSPPVSSDAGGLNEAGPCVASLLLLVLVAVMNQPASELDRWLMD